MTLDQFLQEARYQIRDLFNELCPQRPGPTLQAKYDHLEEDRRECWCRAARHRNLMENIRQRLAQDERRAALLAARVEKSLKMGDRGTAWKDALELDQLRNAMDQDRKQLRTHDRSYRDHLAEVERVKRRLAELRVKMHAPGCCHCS